MPDFIPPDQLTSAAEYAKDAVTKRINTDPRFTIEADRQSAIAAEHAKIDAAFLADGGKLPEPVSPEVKAERAAGYDTSITASEYLARTDIGWMHAEKNGEALYRAAGEFAGAFAAIGLRPDMGGSSLISSLTREGRDARAMNDEERGEYFQKRTDAAIRYFKTEEAWKAAVKEVTDLLEGSGNEFAKGLAKSGIFQTNLTALVTLRGHASLAKAIRERAKK